MTRKRKTCRAHNNHKAGCQPCKDANARWRAANHAPGPNYQPPPRTEADAAYAAGLVELLAQREIDVGRAAIFCALLLDEHAERPS